MEWRIHLELRGPQPYLHLRAEAGEIALARTPPGLSELIAESRSGKRAALEAAARALEAVDPRALVKRALGLRGGTVTVGGRRYDLGGYERIYVLGGGKASGLMAAGAEDLIGERLERGAVVVPDYQLPFPRLEKIEFLPSTHPLPTEKGIRSVNRMLEVAEMAREGDLVVCLISGGGSSLMPLPAHGVTLGDLRRTTHLLLGAGATIREINCVRKHLSQIAGGRLLQRVHGAEVLSLIISDVVGDDPGSIASGPTAPDPSTYGQAVSILKRRGIWDEVPPRASALLERGSRGAIGETPKPGAETFAKVRNVIVGSNATACEAARGSLEGKGARVGSFRLGVVGEARRVGAKLGELGRVSRQRRPWAAVWGGETTVTLRGGGRGGRNQEVALAAALKLEGSPGVTALSLGTDGVDGPTDAAGAVVDSGTCARAREAEVDPRSYLNDNDSYSFFREVGGLVVTGPTRTNVSDLMILVRE